MPQFRKHFTVEEANDLLPDLQDRMRGLQAIGARLREEWPAVVPALKAAPHNGGGKKASEYVRRLSEFNAGLQHLHEQGILLKDLERGLVDFPHMRDGNEVLLCYEMSENEVEYWHDLESGFTGRQRL